ncbi:DNA replication/repair protein RecF [Thiocystis violacea]|uniref:DNA replication/repair protein RecF n=1 Tax=Thiocystis violacea TaxID=13725 RepID=UPI0019033C4D|nr:DNA replication and repair protein RecF [Thiocystis violacea]MBK1717453.1 hypothetical protein [Thiocystis violacea]
MEMARSIGAIRSLKIESLRNVERFVLQSESPAILLTGLNGAGKTTILEAIYLLARGRSFRGKKAGAITTRGEPHTRIECLYDKHDQHPLKVRYFRDSAGVLRDFSPPSWPKGTGDWLAPLQVKLIGENSQTLLEGEPSLRRRFLDWNVFHVEPRFAQLHKDFHRILMQRNSAIRSGHGQRPAWDRLYLELSDEIDRLRRDFQEEWRTNFKEIRSDYPFLRDAEIKYQRGWPEGMTLSESLDVLRDQELARGYTLSGPSKADFHIINGTVRSGFSRGQAKIVVSLLQLAAERVHLARGRDPTVWLLDDLEAELDMGMAERLWNAFCLTDSQIFATRVSSGRDPGVFACSRTIEMFHVEHGAMVDAS